jgi:Peptidase A4 family
MWYELLPAASVPIKLKVFPGNAITASVKVNGTKVTLQIKNLTRKTTFTKTLRMSAPDLSSAEWVGGRSAVRVHVGRPVRAAAALELRLAGLHARLDDRERSHGDDQRHRLDGDADPARVGYGPAVHLERSELEQRRPDGALGRRHVVSNRLASGFLASF